MNISANKLLCRNVYLSAGGSGAFPRSLYRENFLKTGIAIAAKLCYSMKNVVTGQVTERYTFLQRSLFAEIFIYCNFHILCL